MAELIDLTGKRFGRLTVLSKGEARRTTGGQFKATWICQCDCGNITQVDGERLRRGRTTSCGCLVHENKSRMKDITGERFGRLTVIKFIPQAERENPGRQWLCKCDCGNVIQVNSTKLRSGHTRSCGCLVKEATVEASKKYEHQDKVLYRRWRAIFQRCYVPSSRQYHNYGGRGIKICDAWSNPNDGFDRFYEWAVNNGYAPELTLDRIDVDGDYAPENCRWITNQAQQNNRRDNVVLTYNGETHTLTEWSRLLGVNYSTLRYHIYTMKRSLTEYMNKFYHK